VGRGRSRFEKRRIQRGGWRDERKEKRGGEMVCFNYAGERDM